MDRRHFATEEDVELKRQMEIDRLDAPANLSRVESEEQQCVATERAWLLRYRREKQHLIKNVGIANKKRAVDIMDLIYEQGKYNEQQAELDKDDCNSSPYTPIGRVGPPHPHPGEHSKSLQGGRSRVGPHKDKSYPLLPPPMSPITKPGGQ